MLSDAWWVQEFINYIYGARLSNNKLNTLIPRNQHAEVAIQLSSGTTERTIIKNSIMQGTVWGSLMHPQASKDLWPL